MYRPMSAYLNNASRCLNTWTRCLVCTMGIGMTVIVAVQVFSRYVLNHSLFWSEELARLLLIWLTFLGATVAYYHQAHPGVDGLFRRLPGSWQICAALTVHLAEMALFLVMIVSGAEFAWFVKRQITPALNLSKWVVMAVVPVSGGIFLVHCMAFIGRIFSGRDNDH